MEITQKKRSNKHTFTFKENHLSFAYEDKTGTGEIDIAYGDFPNKLSTRIEQSDGLKLVGILWTAIGAYQLGYGIYNNLTLSGRGFWLFLGIICLLVYYFTKVKYSVFNTERGSVFVIQGRNHDQIIDEIKTRRKKQLFDWYGAINPENPIENEINKFNWLVKEEIIPKEEGDKKIEQIRTMHSQTIANNDEFKPDSVN